MVRMWLLLLWVGVCSVANAGTYTVTLLGYPYEDTTTHSIEPLFQKVMARSAFLNDIKAVDGQAPKLRPHKNKTTVFFISILLLYVFAGVRLMFAHQFTGSLQMLKNMNDKRKVQAETDHISIISFYALYLITLGYTTYCFLVHYKGFFAHISVISGVLICIAGVTFLFMLKTIMMNITAWTFDKKAVLHQYYLNVSMVYKIGAIVLFPLAILILISSEKLALLFLQCAVLILILASLLRILRNSSLMKKLLTVHFLHFIVYLCAFEIIPLMLLFKFLR